jgi:flagella basal body P-ring formation protein FlgA
MTMMKTKHIQWIVLSSLLMVITGTTQAINNDELTWIQLPKEHIASGTDTAVYLYEVAETIKGNDADFISKLLPVPVMETPEPGSHQRLANHQIILALRKAGLDTLHIRFAGNKLVDVYGPGQSISRKDMVDAIEQRVMRDTGLNADDLQLQVISSPPYDAWLKPGEFDMQVDRVNPNVLGTSRYNVRFVQDRIVTHDEAFLVNVSRKREVFMPVDNLPRGTVMEPEYIRKEVKFIDQEAKDKLYVDNIDDIVGKKIRNTLRQSDIITWNILETNYIVNRGATVRAVLSSDKFTMQTTAKTESRGAPGDIIPIKMELTGKVLNAKVLTHDMVEIITQ